ncbi:tRNA epoxyqueuosine(34) reductase QueG [Paenibacillus lentus]|uniref:tRNA epoxyqueuosine(34) reductase QueG n=1 Tax=Paenibacillus lentus TaxID=1338368 RepID=UPI00365EBFE1
MTEVRPRAEGGQGKAKDWAGLKQEIKDAAYSMGIDDIGFASADPFLSLKNVLLDRRSKGYESGFEEPDIDKRIYPELSLERPASLISIAVAYPSKLNNPPKSEPGLRRGILARSAWGQDYHAVLREAMARLEEFIVQRVEGARIESMVDTGALVDRAVAERAGIGFKAKNCMVISPKWGSWIYLGELITNIPFEPDTPVTEDCGECTKCIDSCPTGALVGPGELNAQRCVSFLTQTKGFLEDELMRKIGNRLYGCDTCQIVCPKNKGKSWSHRPELQPDPETVKPLLLPLLELSNREFKERFGSSAAAWRGKKPIQRNAVIALGNFKDKAAVPKLIDIMRNDSRPVLRGTAAWGLSRIGGEEALQAVTEAISAEKDEEVLERLHTARGKLQGEEVKLEAKAAIEMKTNAGVKADTNSKTEAKAKPGAKEAASISAEPGCLYYTEMDSPIGVLTLCASDRGLCHIEFGPFADRAAFLEKWAKRYYPGARYVRAEKPLAPAVSQLRAYFAGERHSFDLALDLQGTEFQRRVWAALLDIPYGAAVSYKSIAENIGQPKAVRAVGGANNKNPLPIIVPCHRVIGSGGALVGYGGGLSIKESLLSLEGYNQGRILI